jgi:hypothetical protein
MAGSGPDLQVFGEVGAQARLLARHGREGALLASRDFVGRLPAQARSRLVYGVPVSSDPQSARRLTSFARLKDAGGELHGLPRRMGDMPVAEIIELRDQPLSEETPP